MEPQPESPSPSPSAIARVERKAILLLILISTLVLGFLLYVMYARGVFESTQQLVLISDDAEGVIVGMDLTFAGFPIGRVRRIELAPDGKARMVIDVPRKDAHWLRTSSIFTMERGMVGETHIRAFSGILADPPLPENSERTVLRGDTSAEIPRLVATTRALLENLENMTGPESSINTSLGHLNTVTERLSGRYGMLTGVMGSEENAKKIIATLDRTNALLAKTDQRIYGPNGVMDGTQAAVTQLNAVLKEASASLKKVDAVLAEAQAVGANARVASTDLGALRAEVEISLRKVSQLVDEVNRKWPFARDTELKLP
ncbi:MAG: mammalian cell entry protein [Rhodoferax sp.]|uniref:MlaD family protein n=1 Tax=Rhodoferax sp. TaxID=50421 RepID=UPI0018281AF9|nr:MlaD family protein [Rhodoferax sp.]NMM12319.1 mammalian cell entry protein [Rhodoferax sp.]NMM20278.1 mammalian cell entry protein [Rhodoferax sp.]